MKIRKSDVQSYRFLSQSSIEVESSALLLLCGPIRLFYEVVAAGRQDDLDVLDSVEHRKLAQHCPVTP